MDMNKDFLFTSESVTEGHPDKVADQISDGVLDAVLAEDPQGRVACETLVTTGLVFVVGEITTSAYVDIPAVVRGTLKEIGYSRGEFGIDYKNCSVISSIDPQSPDIAMGVDTGGAGDQGLMFGYACDETPVFMPMPIYLAHRLTERLAKIRKNGVLPYLRPDGKSQVTVQYEGGVAKRIATVVLAAQHDEEVASSKRRDDLLELVVHNGLPGISGEDSVGGQPSVHRAFGEGIAILAGDALLMAAFGLLSEHIKDGEMMRLLTRELCKHAGSMGMIGGFVMDILSRGRTPDEKTVEYIYSHKAGGLAAASAVLGGVAADAPEEQVEALKQYGLETGTGMKMTNDIVEARESVESVLRPPSERAPKSRIAFWSFFTSKEYADAHPLEGAIRISFQIPTILGRSSKESWSPSITSRHTSTVCHSQKSPTALRHS